MKLSKRAADVQPGDQVYFSNDRRPQEVLTVETTELSGNIRISAAGSQLVTRPDFKVKYEGSDEEGQGESDG